MLVITEIVIYCREIKAKRLRAPFAELFGTRRALHGSDACEEDVKDDKTSAFGGGCLGPKHPKDHHKVPDPAMNG